MKEFFEFGAVSICSFAIGIGLFGWIILRNNMIGIWTLRVFCDKIPLIAFLGDCNFGFGQGICFLISCCMYDHGNEREQ